MDDENDVLVSGWGDVEDMREDLLKDWGEMLEKWDGKDRSRPGKLIKLCRKVSYTVPYCCISIGREGVQLLS